VTGSCECSSDPLGSTHNVKNFSTSQGLMSFSRRILLSGVSIQSIMLQSVFKLSPWNCKTDNEHNNYDIK